MRHRTRAQSRLQVTGSARVRSMLAAGSPRAPRAPTMLLVMAPSTLVVGSPRAPRAPMVPSRARVLARGSVRVRSTLAAGSRRAPRAPTTLLVMAPSTLVVGSRRAPRAPMVPSRARVLARGSVRVRSTSVVGSRRGPRAPTTPSRDRVSAKPSAVSAAPFTTLRATARVTSHRVLDRRLAPLPTRGSARLLAARRAQSLAQSRICSDGADGAELKIHNQPTSFFFFFFFFSFPFYI
jgi:hypothetical protein